MFGFTAKTKFAGTLKRKAKKAAIRTTSHGAGAVRKAARESIRYRKNKRKRSPAGSPPFTHGSRRALKNAILYDVDKTQGRAVIGPSFRRIRTGGKPHEFGGRYKGVYFQERPFMWPALKKTSKRFPVMWKDQIT